jgi:CDGSH-type Zn-finger protein
MKDAPEPRPLVVFTRYTPYLAVDVGDCRDAEGRPVAMQPVTALCRCGASAHKPYCDGAHSRIGFTGEKGRVRNRDRVHDVVGREITIHDNRGLCAHDESCVRGLPAVFRSDRTPWIDPDAASPAQIMATIDRCPSGALTYTYRGRSGPAPERPPAIRIVKNGPYRLEGGIRIRDDLGSKPRSHERCTLCRCGQARNKPFCDGSHDEAPFEDCASPAEPLQ